MSDCQPCDGVYCTGIDTVCWPCRATVPRNISALASERDSRACTVRDPLFATASTSVSGGRSIMLSGTASNESGEREFTIAGEASRGPVPPDTFDAVGGRSGEMRSMDAPAGTHLVE